MTGAISEGSMSTMVEPACRFYVKSYSGTTNLYEITDPSHLENSMTSLESRKVSQTTELVLEEL